MEPRRTLEWRALSIRPQPSPTMTAPTAATTAPPPTERTPFWEDFVDILFSPASVFKRREHASWFKPMLVVSLAIIVITLASKGVLQPVYDAEIDKAMEKLRENPQVTEEIIERSRSMANTFGTIAIIVSTPIIILVVGLMTWLVGKLVDSRQELHAALVVASYAMVPRVIQAVVNAVQGLVLGPDQLTSVTRLSFGPARFLDPSTASPVTLQLVNRFDLFTIWVTVLLAIGLYVTGRVSKNKAVIGGILFWLVGSIPALLGALRQGAPS